MVALLLLPAITYHYPAHRHTYALPLISPYNDNFLLKYDSSGTPQWARSVPTHDIEISAVSTDINGNAYVISSFASIAGLLIGSFTLVSYGSIDAYVVKYNKYGTAVWAKNLGGYDLDYGRGIALDPAGNLWVSGAARSNLFNIGTMHMTCDISTNGSAWLAKLDTNGNPLYMNNFRNGSYNGGSLVMNDNFGNTYLSGGYMNGNCIIGTDTLQTVTVPIPYYFIADDVYLAKLGNTSLVPPCLAPPITGLFSVCAGSNVTLNDSLGAGTWSSSNTGIATVNPVSGKLYGIIAGTSVITYTSGPGCVSTQVITVNPLPVAVSITGSSVVCVATTDTLSDIITGGIWSSTATSIATTGSTGIITGVTAGTTTISYNVTNSCGSAFAIKTITVNQLPVAGVIGVSSAVCPGMTVTTTETSTGGTWSSSSILTATIDSVTGVVTGVASGSVTLSYTVTNDCGSAVANDAITVHPLPFAGTISGSAVVCNGTSVVLTATTTGGSWSTSGAAASVVDGVVTGLITGIDTVKYTITNVCGDAVARKVMDIEPLPTVHAITGGGSYCSASAGADIGLLGSETSCFYQLFMGIVPIGAPVTGTGGALDFGPFTDLGTYTIEATNSSTGCDNDMAGSTTITVTPTITPTVTVTANPGTNIGVSASDTLTATATGGGSAPAYQWYKNGTAIPGATDNVYVGSSFFNGDTISCRVVNTDTCGATGSDHVVITLVGVGVKTVQAQEQFKVYPNPSNGTFTVCLLSNIDEQVNIVVTNVVGEKVSEISSVTNKPTSIKLINASGVYFVAASTTSGKYVVKVVVND